MKNSFFTSATDAMVNLADFTRRQFYPKVRLGVTGLSRSGKTVFTTAFIHHLVSGSPLTAFKASSEGRIRRVLFEPQPDDTIQRFPFEEHMKAVSEERCWPQSTKRISELRLDIEYEHHSRWRTSPARLAIDIVDYPGEWLTDLTLLNKSYRDWSDETILASRAPHRMPHAKAWHEALRHKANDKPDEAVAAQLAQLFTHYLQDMRNGPELVATHPPGRFLMPGDLAGSPALTFAPLQLHNLIAPKTLGALMESRFEAYKRHVVRPFFQDHFQKIDCQIVLVDVLAGLDSGPLALAELEKALDDVLLAFSIGRNSLISNLFSPRADRILFAATKADHLHHTSHDRLEAILELLVSRALQRTQSAGAKTGIVALASIRATRETTIKEGNQTLRAVAGTPENGETVGDERFDGLTEAAIFPGELPENAKDIFSHQQEKFRFPRFRPPLLKRDGAGRLNALPHIRFDRALEFLIGDRLK